MDICKLCTGTGDIPVMLDKCCASTKPNKIVCFNLLPGCYGNEGKILYLLHQNDIESRKCLYSSGKKRLLKKLYKQVYGIKMRVAEGLGQNCSEDQATWNTQLYLIIYNEYEKTGFQIKYHCKKKC